MSGSTRRIPRLQYRRYGTYSATMYHRVAAAEAKTQAHVEMMTEAARASCTHMDKKLSEKLVLRTKRGFP